MISAACFAHGRQVALKAANAEAHALRRSAHEAAETRLSLEAELAAERRARAAVEAAGESAEARHTHGQRQAEAEVEGLRRRLRAALDEREAAMHEAQAARTIQKGIEAQARVAADTRRLMSLGASVSLAALGGGGGGAGGMPLGTSSTTTAARPGGSASGRSAHGLAHGRGEGVPLPV